MDTWLLIVLIVAAVVVLALVFMASRKARVRRDERNRVEAGEHREEARVRGARAERQQAEAEQQAARARAELADADEQAALAGRQRRAAEERHQEAARLDPDVDEKEAGGLPRVGERTTANDPDTTPRESR
jgi:flagellar biosynthesis/type III secretory pathway M-ring protein FliF/YscJ